MVRTLQENEGYTAPLDKPGEPQAAQNPELTAEKEECMPAPNYTTAHRATDQGSRQIVIWETSAINNLARLGNRADLIARTEVAYTHCIPMYVFDEIAETQSGATRDCLLGVCRKLMGNYGWVLKSPSLLISEAVRAFSASGEIAWSELLGQRPEYERAIASGTVFDDNLAGAQKSRMQLYLKEGEEFFAGSKARYDHYFLPGSDGLRTVEEVVEQSRSTRLVGQNVQHFFKAILGQEIDLRQAEGFAGAFPPIRSLIYSCLIAHYRRHDLPLKRRPAGIIDLSAAVYLPVCHKYVSDDWDQQTVLRDVAKYCAFSAEIICFSKDFKKRFAG